MILEEQFPVWRNTAASKIDKLCHYFVAMTLWCHNNPDRHKFSSLSNTTVEAIFPIFFVYRDIVYAQTWEILTLKNCIKPP